MRQLSLRRNSPAAIVRAFLWTCCRADSFPSPTRLFSAFWAGDRGASGV